MKWSLLAVAGLAFVLGASDARAAQVKKESADDKTIKALIADLGNDSFDKREAAHKRLLGIGLPALELLKKAVKESTDAEVRQRAINLAEDIEAASKKFSY